jgi:ribokinase
MSRFYVSGLTNIETTLKVGGFPIDYAPCHYPFHGVHTGISGVGINIAYALKALGDDVNSATIVGRDFFSEWVRADFREHGISDEYIVSLIPETPQSVILYDPSGKRQINVDLKEVQETAYPEALFEKGTDGADIAVLCNINFSRRFLAPAKKKGLRIATDVHCVADLEDTYNRDFMLYADILFMSDEHIEDPRDFIVRTAERYDNSIIVIGLGGSGALLYVKNEGVFHYPAVSTRAIVNTIGAGDALFSAFIHFLAKGRSPHEALKRAICFASYKIGAKGAAEGFICEAEVEKIYAEKCGA